MQVQNNNTYSIMYGMEFLKAGEIKEVSNKEAKMLLAQPNVVEYVSKEQVTALEEENKKLKEQLVKGTTKKSAKK